MDNPIRFDISSLCSTWQMMKASMRINAYRFTICLLALSIGLSACGLGKKKEAGQVAAKVNGAEITVQQINQVLSHIPGVTAENADKSRKEILERLIVQELAVAKATESKLDQNPEVLMALDASRRDILARSYFNQIAGTQNNVGETEVKRYFDEHPDLFSQRRIYSLMDIALQRDEKLIALLQDMVANHKPMQEIARRLKENGTKFEAHNYASAAEQLSLELLPKIAKLADGQTTVIVAGQTVHVINVVNSRQEPIDFATASPQIQKYLGTERGQQQISSAIKKLRDTAKVEYLGEFAAENPQGGSSAPAGAAAENIAKNVAELK
jgi:EpsD family peptidyl-prolyl cis-trans isomerase